MIEDMHNKGVDAMTGQLFCTLTILGIFFLMLHYPMSMTFLILPQQLGNSFPDRLRKAPLPVALTGMAGNLGKALTADAFLALVSHRRFLHFGKEKGVQLLKNTLDIAIIGLMIVFTFAHMVLFGLPSTSQSAAAMKTMAAMDYLCIVFYVLAIINAFASSRSLRRRLLSLEAGK